MSIKKRQIVLDTETTGLLTSDGNRIIEIGCIELINRQRSYQDLHFYINPKREMEAGALAVHGITLESLADKPVFSDIMEELMHYLQGAELIIHNAVFDIGFLDYELKLAGSKYPPITQYCSILDTLEYARKKHAGQRNSLDALCKRYSVDNTNRKLHGALLDAELLAEVYLAMTGGQASLFIEAALDEQPSTIVLQETNLNKQNWLEEDALSELMIILPSSEEQSAHQDFLKLIQSCVKPVIQ